MAARGRKLAARASCMGKEPVMSASSPGAHVPPALAEPPSPVVSVIVPAYNTARFISEAIQSVLAQTFRDYEVIVVNDGSPDTEDLKRELGPYRNRITYIEQENKGIAGARNAGVRAARGEYVAFLDSDDCWLPRMLEEQLRLLRQEPPVDLVYADAALFGEGTAGTSTCMKWSPSEGPATLESLLAGKCQVLTSTVVARRQAVIDAGLFDESIRAAEDYELWLRLAYCGSTIRYQYNVLSRYRIRPGSLSSSDERMSVSLLQVLEKVEKTFHLSRETGTVLRQRLEKEQAFLALIRGKKYLAQGKFAQAAHSLATANAFFQSAKLRATLLGLRFAPRLTARGVRLYWQDLLKADRYP